MQRAGRCWLARERSRTASGWPARLRRPVFRFNCSTENKPPTKPRLSRGGAMGTVTIATNMAGRGTDIRLGPGVAELGGLHLVGLEHNDSVRVDHQLIGRVARQGNARFVPILRFGGR